MAQLNITLNQEEILQLLCNDRDEVSKTLLQNSLDSLLKAESQQQLKAKPYKRAEERLAKNSQFLNRIFYVT